jgi:fatty acid desaturase
MDPVNSADNNPVLSEPIRKVQAGYAELKRIVKERGLLEKQPGFLTGRIIITLVLLAISVALMCVSSSLWLQIPNAVFMAFIFGQRGFIANDVGHRQAFRTPKINDRVGLLFANLLLGMSFGWWVDKHNKHHAHTNMHDHDPDIDIIVLAFTEEDALEKRGIPRFIVKYQAFFFFPMLTFQAYSLRVGSIGWLMQPQVKRRVLESFLLIMHGVLLAGLSIGTLGLLNGLIFLVIQQALFGLYLASVFAPNHKGMPIIDEDMEIDFMRHQILTSRNVRPTPFRDVWYGGLNYQIEHHLFPTLARNKLREVRDIVKEFCSQHGIEYYETTMAGSYAEILQHLHEVSAPLRRGRRLTTTP